MHTLTNRHPQKSKLISERVFPFTSNRRKYFTLTFKFKNIRKDQFLLIFIGGWGGGVQKSQILAYLIYEWSLIHLEYLEKILLHKKHKESQPIASVIPSSRNESYKRRST